MIHPQVVLIAKTHLAAWKVKLHLQMFGMAARLLLYKLR